MFITNNLNSSFAFPDISFITYRACRIVLQPGGTFEISFAEISDVLLYLAAYIQDGTLSISYSSDDIIWLAEWASLHLLPIPQPTIPTISVTEVTSDYTVVFGPNISVIFLFVDASVANVIITLPSAVESLGKSCYVKKADSSGNTVTIVRVGSDTIDGETEQVISVPDTSITVASSGRLWYIV